MWRAASLTRTRNDALEDGIRINSYSAGQAPVKQMRGGGAESEVGLLIRREEERRYQRGGWQACSKPWFGGTLGWTKRIEEEKEEIHVGLARTGAQGWTSARATGIMGDRPGATRAGVSRAEKMHMATGNKPGRDRS